jgi:hypothetical protein
MPRKTRIDAPGALHHIICRGIERKPIFRDKPWDQLTDEEKQSVASPVDELDSCCETHDKCYAECRENFPCLEDDRKMCFRQCDLQLNMCSGTMNVGGPRSYMIKKYMQDTNPGAGDNSPMCCEK